MLHRYSRKFNKSRHDWGLISLHPGGSFGALFRHFSKRNGISRHGQRATRHRIAPKRYSSIKGNIRLIELGTRYIVKRVYHQGPQRPPKAQLMTSFGSFTFVALLEGVFLGTKITLTRIAWWLRRGYKLGSYYWAGLLKPGMLICDFFLFSGLNRYWARSPGTCCKILFFTTCGRYVFIELPSMKKKRLHLDFFCGLGRISLKQHQRMHLGAAGDSRKSGFKPHVRGIAKNPVDHPHGGRTNTSKPEVSPWGWVAKHRH